MAITHVQGAGENGATSASFSAAVAPGDLVCVLFGHGAGTVASITDDQSNSYTIFASGTVGGGTVGVAYRGNITNRPRTITMNGSGLAYPSLIIDEFSGAGAFDLGNSTLTTANSAALPSGAITPARNGELLYAGGWALSSTSLVIASPWTSLENAGSYANELSAWQVQGTAAPVAANFTPSNGSDTGFAAILAFSPAGSSQNVVADALVPAEAGAAGMSDAAAALEMLASFLPAPLWIEWTEPSSASSLGLDNLFSIEVLATRRSDTCRSKCWRPCRPPMARSHRRRRRYPSNSSRRGGAMRRCRVNGRVQRAALSSRIPQRNSNGWRVKWAMRRCRVK